MKNFTSVHDVPDIPKLVNEAVEIKKYPLQNTTLGTHKTLGLIFLNPSLRTRMSTQKAAYNLGMNVIVMNMDKDSWALETREGVIMDGDKAEHAKEAVAVMGEYCDIIGVRSFPGLKDKEADYREEMLNIFLKYVGIPVVSLESATRHPLQSLADLVTIEELKKTKKPKIVLSWALHIKALPQAVPNSFAEWMLAAGHDLTITHPAGHELSEDFTRGAIIEYDQSKALADADFVYVKNWSSFNDYGAVSNRFPDWTFDGKKHSLTNEAKVMHCLPVRRNVVISDEILDGTHSVVIQQAGNRVFAAQAVLQTMLEEME
ncbi:acetylornithine carbamoyltransferase [Marivirga sp. S37H4]|uniref:N-succinylornithine carbamoyltransferase n=1 Tax=Marivirga aurantiaca TaxID=2802615 RepID=A0A934WXY0_9BACT|nr:acetylornithine carbamoyltransferase [Marivirga aurantiaca]MBK6264922.1 acetylornithine carbamoyltransferase [Marivirga aurantiaca]